MGEIDLTFRVEIIDQTGPGKPESEDCHDFAYNKHVNGRVLCLADGMGGYENGRDAANLVVRSVMRDFATVREKDLCPEKLARSMLNNAHERLKTHREKTGSSRMGCTLALSVCLGGRIALLNVGDSRIYTFYSGGLSMRSQDHTLGRDLGLEDDPQNRHPSSNILTRAITGEDRAPEPWVCNISKMPGLKILMTTDGLHAYLDPYFMERAIKMSPPDEALHILAIQARSNGSSDDLCGILACCE